MNPNVDHVYNSLILEEDNVVSIVATIIKNIELLVEEDKKEVFDTIIDHYIWDQYLKPILIKYLKLGIFSFVKSPIINLFRIVLKELVVPMLIKTMNMNNKHWLDDFSRIL